MSFNRSFHYDNAPGVDFGDTLTEILKKARKEQLKNRMQYSELYHCNYYKEISFVCLRPDGSLELPSTLSIVCRSVAKKLERFEDFHFHQLRHTYTSNLLSNGSAPKDVQELLGHSDVSTTMNIFVTPQHSTKQAINISESFQKSIHLPLFVPKTSEFNRQAWT